MVQYISLLQLRPPIFYNRLILLQFNLSILQIVDLAWFLHDLLTGS
jgi:hypothetical protein